MPIDMQQAQAAVRSGLSLYCATCTHYWGAVDQGRQRCLAPGPCGSPLAGHEFAHYDGPITEAARWCFACGAPAGGFGVSRPGSDKVFGLCPRHEHLVQLRPEGQVPPFVVVRRGTALLAASELVRPRRNRLLEAMVAQQQEWDEADAKRSRR